MNEIVMCDDTDANAAIEELEARVRELEAAGKALIKRWHNHSGACVTYCADGKPVVTTESCKCEKEEREMRKVLGMFATPSVSDAPEESKILKGGTNMRASGEKPYSAEESNLRVAESRPKQQPHEGGTSSECAAASGTSSDTGAGKSCSAPGSRPSEALKRDDRVRLLQDNMWPLSDVNGVQKAGAMATVLEVQDDLVCLTVDCLGDGFSCLVSKVEKCPRTNEAPPVGNPPTPNRARARHVIAQARAAGDVLDFGMGLEAKIMAALDKQRTDKAKIECGDLVRVEGRWGYFPVWTVFQDGLVMIEDIKGASIGPCVVLEHVSRTETDNPLRNGVDRGLRRIAEGMELLKMLTTTTDLVWTYPHRRADGWPLCPQCGDDELFSSAIPATEATIAGCYACNWKPKPRAETATPEGSKK